MIVIHVRIQTVHIRAAEGEHRLGGWEALVIIDSGRCNTPGCHACLASNVVSEIRSFEIG